ncbi:molecular chaperone [Terriglobus roseus DSM 18391]|uniref:Anhydro-N-acetylmuramic acid kinase n=1 Tax=Terriglobus roseus (strain DSM 18391 / NRRL B-41598 / KBS 63) TaxID=926566 RepID=I3ZGW9_TERRK|nr:anhydro-N-acetylmuramic acid kinase [Terriglobus roseus]AFL88487.1 molecular chaperone [Terriglobus roseus DSM 18391]AFL88828.1 molecular chaperone [Terriglobus roseus DSM 18391]
MTETPKPMIVAGVMSGTSADGVDVALVRIAAGKADASPKMKLLGHAALPYPKKLREAVLAAMDAKAISVADLARLHWRLGEFYGDAIVRAQQQLGVKAKLAGVHGQTIYHQGVPAKFLGDPLRCTWQIGEASEVASRAAMPVVSDFRPADMVAGGQAAPLVPIFDRVFFAHAKRNRVLQNLGGIANMTAIPAGTGDLLAFDSGPASVVIDGCMQSLYGKAYDRNGATAKRGRVIDTVLQQALKLPYFSAPPPKSCGREEFGGTFVTRFIADCRKQGAQDADVIATATALTAESILHAYRSFVWPFLGQRAPLADATDYIVAGGGANNATLMKLLRDGLEPLGITVSTSADHGVPAEAKEAMAFALLAWLRWHELPGNVPAATGAKRDAALGRVTLP